MSYVISRSRGVIGRLVGGLPPADRGGYVFRFMEPQYGQTLAASPPDPHIIPSTRIVEFSSMGHDWLVCEETACYLMARPETRLSGRALFIRTREPHPEAVFSVKVCDDGAVELVDPAGLLDDGRPVTVARLHADLEGRAVAYYIQYKAEAARRRRD